VVKLETETMSLGVVELRGIAIPAEYEPLPEPTEFGDLAPARRLYRAIGQEPTRNRPSSELLIRRIRKGLGLPRINALVDAVNHCSATLALPFGCYDRDRIRGEVVVRLGREGEAFEGVGHRIVHVADRYAACDDEGPFGNPTMDSMRTRITLETRNALVLVYAPADHDLPRLPWVAAVLGAVAGGEVRSFPLHPRDGDLPRV
jgi:DNA/RNA-binding domain of Phe-tRNA-synthetase-like protein